MQKSSGDNYGIQANSVSAEAMSVGPNAQAIKYGASPSDAEALKRALVQLEQAVGGLGLPPGPQALLQKDVQGLSDATQGDKPDAAKATSHIQGIADKLSMVGKVLHDIAEIAEPVSKIGRLLHIPLTFLTGL
jgi:hypothetical protein